MISAPASSYPNAHYLAEPDWLNAHINDNDVCVIDARFDLRVREDGSLEEVSGRDDFLVGHIPGAQFVDLYTDLVDPRTPTHIIGPEAFETLMSRLGIGPHSTVVIYDDRGGAWAARLWWALRYYGHGRAKMLNGGLSAWCAAGHNLQSEINAPPPAQFTASVQPQFRVGKEEVLAAIDAPLNSIVDALPAPYYLGQAGLYPDHRMGHVPGAHNVSTEDQIDPDTLRIKPMEALQVLWKDVNLTPDQTVITYCGGGIYASFALFILALMGHEKAALYDASWMEWGADDSLPVETGKPVAR